MTEIASGTTLPELPDHLSAKCSDFVCQAIKRDPAERPRALELLKHAWLKSK